MLHSNVTAVSAAGRAAAPRKGRMRSGAPLALAAVLGGSFLAFAPGCALTPAIVDAAITVCRAVIMQVLDRPTDELPPGYEPCGSDSWTVHGRTVRFCFFCRPGTQEPPIVQLDCEGAYYPFKRSVQAADPHRPRPLSPTAAHDGISIEKLDCSERLLAAGEARCDPTLAFASFTIIAPNDRELPHSEHYPELEVLVDGRPSDGAHAPRGSAISVDGPFEQAAHYAASLGVQELSFRADGAHWSVAFNPAFGAAAVFRNGAFHHARFVFAPAQAFDDAP
ncbi:MAG: hypothetical protein ACKOYN_11110 [Planctomycetota bacterium]